MTHAEWAKASLARLAAEAQRPDAEAFDVPVSFDGRPPRRIRAKGTCLWGAQLFASLRAWASKDGREAKHTFTDHPKPVDPAFRCRCGEDCGL
jgi:hypothetical protein